ncbi:putative phospholipase B-like 2 isoform X2 [Ictalurus punctatus]|uniref:Phospholipase B-like n=1 Tax=Ictalurus punctatus TaxID=7998 RepID=A0A2D0R560_ICTPU|nr:putative phospholipase B-like 2 isoform X2 [Ictalurus punctatus]
MLRFLLCTLFVCVISPADTHLRSAVFNQQSGKLQLKEGIQTDFVAFANFTDDIVNTGWSYLEVVTNGKYNDTLQAYAAGVVEGAVTSQLIYKHWMNTLMGYCDPNDPGYCQHLKEYIITNLQWVEEQIKKATESPYWHQVHLSLLQLKGLEDGYIGQCTFPESSVYFNPLGFLLFQMGGDLEDLEAALNKSSQSRTVGSGSCSALIKLLPGNKELLVSHDTWNNYQSMLRIMKRYVFSFRTSLKDQTLIPGHTQAFSSYPGSIFSGDDFYILSSGLVTMETTIGNSNPDLWKFVKPQGSVMEWLRNIVANRLARSGKEWADIFSQYNSGTYNNQWMIVDYKSFIPGRLGLSKGLLTVLEQIPGMIQTADKTEELYNTSYWASYNIPYNNFMNDPLSACDGCNPAQNGENAISARSDLNPANGTYPFGALGQRPHGGTDMKMTSYGLFKQYELLAVSGPTWDQVPAFEWSTSPYSSLTHIGHPDRWDFPTVHIRWSE